VTVRAIGEVLEQIERAPAPVADGVGADAVAELRAALDAAAARAVAGLAEDELPVRLSRDRIARLLTCEQLAVATSSAPAALVEEQVRGRVLDRLLHHHVHGRPATARTGPALAIAEGAFEAERDDELTAWLSGTDPDTRTRLAEDATGFVDRLDALGPVPRDWWPRCEERLRVDLHDGAVRCTARLDLVVGGVPTPHPLVIIEAKSGRFAQEHRDGLAWYALLTALRYAAIGERPTATLAWSAWDGALAPQAVTVDVLRGAADRAIAALDALGDLLRGARVARRTPGRACAWCPERQSCPDAA